MEMFKNFVVSYILMLLCYVARSLLNTFGIMYFFNQCEKFEFISF